MEYGHGLHGSTASFLCANFTTIPTETRGKFSLSIRPSHSKTRSFISRVWCPVRDPRICTFFPSRVDYHQLRGRHYWILSVLRYVIRAGRWIYGLLFGHLLSRRSPDVRTYLNFCLSPVLHMSLRMLSEAHVEREIRAYVRETTIIHRWETELSFEPLVDR